jgi:hypothetical protein
LYQIRAIIVPKGDEKAGEYIDQLIDQVPFFTARGSDPARHVINGEAIVGDMITGKKQGKEILAANPFVAKDISLIKKSLTQLIEAGGEIFYNAHGLACEKESIKKYIES